MSAYPHLLPVFLIEAETCLDELNQAMGLLAGRMDASEAWQSAARAAHTLKGNAAMMQLDSISETAFAAEMLAEAGMAAPAGDTVRLLDACRASLRDHVTSVAHQASRKAVAPGESSRDQQETESRTV